MKVKTEKKEDITQERIIDIPKEELITKSSDPKKRNLGYFIGSVLKGAFLFLKHLLILIEKFIKIIAIFIVTIASSLFFLVGSFYFFSSTFDLKQSPAFKVLRDRIGAIYANQIEEEIQKAEKEKNWQWKGELQNIKEDTETEEKLRQAVVDLKEMKVKEQESALDDLEKKIQEAETKLNEKNVELKELETKIAEQEGKNTP